MNFGANEINNRNDVMSLLCFIRFWDHRSADSAPLYCSVPTLIFATAACSGLLFPDVLQRVDSLGMMSFHMSSLLSDIIYLHQNAQQQRNLNHFNFRSKRFLARQEINIYFCLKYYIIGPYLHPNP